MTNDGLQSVFHVVNDRGAWKAYRAGAQNDVVYSGLDRATAIAHASRVAGLSGEVHEQQPDGTLRKVYPLR